MSKNSLSMKDVPTSKKKRKILKITSKQRKDIVKFAFKMFEFLKLALDVIGKIHEFFNWIG